MRLGNPFAHKCSGTHHFPLANLNACTLANLNACALANFNACAPANLNAYSRNLKN